MQEEKQETDILQLPEGSPKGEYHDNSTAPSSTQNSQETNDNFESKENQNMNVKPELATYHIQKLNNEKMNIEHNANSASTDQPAQKKIDEPAHENRSTPKTSQSASYSSHFVLHSVPLVFSVDDLASTIKQELQKFGEVVKIESKPKSENLVDVNLSFKHEKDAVIALKSNIKIHLGEQNFALNLTPGFKEYLIKLSSAMKTQSNSQNTVKPNPEIKKPEPVVKENSVHNDEKPLKDSVVDTSKIESSKPENDKSIENKKIIIKASVKRKEVPLEIMKPTKSAKSLTKASLNGKNGSSNHLVPPVVNSSNSQQNQQSRSRTKSVSREKEREVIQENPEPKEQGNNKAKNKRSLSRKSKKLAKRKQLRELSQQAKKEQKKEDNKEKNLHIEKKVIESTRNQDKQESLVIIKKARPDHHDSERDNHHHHHSHHSHHHHHDDHYRVPDRVQERSSWTDDEFPCELVCYAVGIPLESDIFSMKDLLQREGFYPHIKMQWKNFEGLDYLKLVFDSKSETQKFLSRPISLHEIPLIILPKLNKNPLEMLGYHQLRIESTSGPIETESVYEFLLKFGPVTDFLVLDSMNNPTTFLVTFTNNSSKRTLESEFSRKPAMLTDKYNRERLLRLEFNIKPALVVRKRLNMTIIHQYKEAQRQLLQPPVKQVFEEDVGMNQAPTPNSGMSNFSAQGPMPQINNMISPIPSTRSGSFNYSPSKPGYNPQFNANYVNENPGYFSIPQGGYTYPRQDPTPMYSPVQPINNFPNYEANMNNIQDQQRNMLPVYQPVQQVQQMPQSFETPSYEAQNQFMGNQMMQTQTYVMPQVNNGMYGMAPYNNMRPASNYPNGANQYSFPNQDGRNNMQYFY